MRNVTPLGALVRGVIAGAVGSALQTGYFLLTMRTEIAREPGPFEPPEDEQRDEQPTETVARRIVEDLAQRGPISEKGKALGGTLVHVGFGCSWAGLYGLARESYPALAGPAGAGAFSLFVWAMGDAVVLPAFRLGAPVREKSAAMIAHEVAAHLVYGFGTYGAYELMRRSDAVLALAAPILARGLERIERRQTRIERLKRAAGIGGRTSRLRVAIAG